MSLNEKGKGQWPKTVHNTSLRAFGSGVLNLRLFLAFKAQDVVFLKLIKVQMPTILCI